MTSETVTRPPSLRSFLEAGCDLAELFDPERLRALAEEAVEAPRLFSAEALARGAAVWRGILGQWLETPAEHLRYSDSPQLDVTALAWRVEIFEDRELAGLVQNALPAQLVDEAMARVEAQRRPFVLAVEQRSTFTCAVCGEAHERSRAVRLAPRLPSWPDLDELPELTFCPDCIGAAAVASRVRRLSAVPPVERLPKMATWVDRLGFVRRKLMEQGYAEKSIRQYLGELRRAEQWCENEGYTLRNVPDVDVARYVALRPRTWASRKLLRSALGHYWRILPRKNPPLWLVRVPRKPRGVCRTAEEEDAAALVRLARRRADKKGLAVLLGLFLALRSEEIASLRWDAFTKDGWVVVVGKGDVEAKLPVHPLILHALGWVEGDDPVWVFPGRRPGAHVTPATIWTWVVDFGREAGVEDLTPHRLRHTCLATANDRTGDLRAVQDFARHAKIDTTSMYTRATAERLVDVMRSLDYGADASDLQEG